jgi:adenylylsulfate kinase
MNNQGIFLWIMGLAGSGKSTIANLTQQSLKAKGINIIWLDGDILRNILNIQGHSLMQRRVGGLIYLKLCSVLTKQGYNVILSSIGMQRIFEDVGKDIMSNYHQILIKTNLDLIVESNSREFYSNNESDVMGLDISPESLNYDLVINNDLKNNLEDKVRLCVKFFEKLI